MRPACAALLLALLVACGGGSSTSPPADIPVDVSDVHVFSSSVIPDGEQAKVSLALHNAGSQPDALTGVTCPCADAVSITGGHFALPSEKVVIVSATGKGPHIVLSGLTTSLQSGDTVTLTLTFVHATPTSVVTKVELAR